VRDYRERLALLAALMPALHARRGEVLARPDLAGVTVGLPASGSAWLGRLSLTLAVYANGSAGLLRVEPEGAPPEWIVGAAGSMLTGAGQVWTATAEGALLKHAGPRPAVPFLEAWRRFRLAVHEAPRTKPSLRTLWDAAAWLGVTAA
jgi:hypothetical protein